MLGLEARALHIFDKHSTTELYPQPCFSIFWFQIKFHVFHKARIVNYDCFLLYSNSSYYTIPYADLARSQAQRQSLCQIVLESHNPCYMNAW
jgi:hypothetical protein